MRPAEFALSPGHPTHSVLVPGYNLYARRQSVYLQICVCIFVPVVRHQLSYLCLRFWWQTEAAQQIPHSRKQWTFIMADSKLSKPLELKAGCSCGRSRTRISLLCQLCQVCTHIIHQWQDQWWCIDAGWVWAPNTSNLELDKINKIMTLDCVDVKCNFKYMYVICMY